MTIIAFALTMLVLSEVDHPYLGQGASHERILLSKPVTLARGNGRQTAKDAAARGIFVTVEDFPPTLGAGVYWLKFAATSDLPEPGAAVLWFGCWDRIQLFAEDGERLRAVSGWRVGRADQLDTQPRLAGSLNNDCGVPVVIASRATEHFLVRLESQKPGRSAFVRITPARVRIGNADLVTVKALSIGALFLLLMFAVGAFLVLRRSTYLWYAAHLVSILAYWLAASGIGSDLFYTSEPSVNAQVILIAIFAVAPTMLLFARSHLALRLAVSGRVLLILAVGTTLMALLGIAADQLGAVWPEDLAILSAFTGYTAALVVALLHRHVAQFLIAALMFSALGFLVFHLDLTNVIDLNFDSQLFGLVGSLGEACLLTLSLAFAYRGLERKLSREQLRLRQLEIEVERERRESLESRGQELETEIKARTALLERERARSDQLLLSVLPSIIAEELKSRGSVEARRHDEVTVLFSDFGGFTNIASTIPPAKLVAELNDIFSAFDSIMARNGVEKIKTVGDAYLAASGLPQACNDHAAHCASAAIEMASWIEARNAESPVKWRIRIGIHSGPVVAGVVGTTKYSYDIWGDTVNTAARLESTSEEGRINVSAYTASLLGSSFKLEYRGKLDAKGKGEIDMYFLTAALPITQLP
jgi:class 3 adenylate cyclase